MKDVFRILEEVANTSSRNEKIDILNRNRDNESLMHALEYTYNPYKVYGIGSKAFRSSYTSNEFASIFELLDYLLEHSTGSAVDKSKVNAFLRDNPEEAEWYTRMLLKNLKIGMTAATINKIWPGLIPQFDVMLAEPYDREVDSAAIEYKIDGCRCIAVNDNGVRLFTRNGKPIQGFSQIERELSRLMDDKKIVLDGEIVGVDYKDTMNKLFAEGSHKRAMYMVFDILPAEDFARGVCELSYTRRKQMLKDLFADMNFDSLVMVQPIGTLNRPTIEQLQQYMTMAVEQGYEGIMIKDTQAPYVCRRSYSWQKLKPFQTAEFSIIGFEEGNDRLTGMLGKVIVDVNGVAVGVGSGFSDEERQWIWNHRRECLGRFIEVQYSRVLGDSGSLLFPTVKGFRYDIT